MKKILLATTVLVGGAGFAAAEVTLSGDARMGVLQDFGDGDVGFTSRARVKFTMSGETDGGLAFGASFRADNAGNEDSGDAADGRAGSVFLSGAFGKLSMGDVDGAALSAVGHIDGVGLTGLSDFNESIYLANGGIDDDGSVFGGFVGILTDDPTALYEYSTGSFTVYASATQPNYEVVLPPAIEGDAYAIGAKYAVDAYTFGIGYEDLSVDVIGFGEVIDVDHLIASAAATFSGVTVKGTYGRADGTAFGSTFELDQWGISATYVADALSVTAFLNNKKIQDAGVTTIDLDAYGLGAAYDLGGGASVVGGVASIDDGGPGGSDTAWDLGVSFSF